LNGRNTTGLNVGWLRVRKGGFEKKVKVNRETIDKVWIERLKDLMFYLIFGRGIDEEPTECRLSFY
jgi:hypothetical protein